MRRPVAELAAAGGLAALVVVSGVLVIGAAHDARQLFVELQSLNREQDRLQVDWGRLRLEESTWATHSRIESVARKKLNFSEPTDEQIVIVEGANRRDGQRGR